MREKRMPGLSLKEPEATAFVPVSVAPETSNSARTQPVPIPSLPLPAQLANTAPTSKRRSGAVEIRLANGRVIKVDEGIAPDALARLLAVVDGDRS